MRIEKRRSIVCLCGSTRFHKEYVQQNMNETMKGNIVLSCGVFGHTIHSFLELDEFDKENLHDLHKEKILMSDEILVLDADNYIGESTRKEIEFARTHHKIIRFLVSPKVFVSCYSCDESITLRPSMSGSDGEFGWDEYTGYCERCRVAIEMVISNGTGGIDLVYRHHDHE